MNEKQISTIKKHLVVKGNQVMTTSLDVANFFNKKHKNVLRAIQGLECSQEFGGLNFEPAEYTDTKGEKRPMYKMTRDGFTMLAFGFTGTEAIRFREAYISAFNRMEAELRGHTPHPAPQTDLNLLLTLTESTSRMFDLMGKTLERLDERLERLEQAPARQLPAAGRSTPASTPVVRQVAAFVGDSCRLAAGAVSPKGALYASYAAWCRAEGDLPYNPSTFFKMLYRVTPTRGIRRRQGCKCLLLVRGIVPQTACYQQTIPGMEA